MSGNHYTNTFLETLSTLILYFFALGYLSFTVLTNILRDLKEEQFLLERYLKHMLNLL